MGKQYLNGVLYGTGEIIKFSPYIYSLEEREVGVWTDGKPLYEKVIKYTITTKLSSGVTELFTLDSTFCVQCMDAYVHLNSSTDTLWKIPYVNENSASTALTIQGNKVYAKIHSDSWSTAAHLIMVIQYTKTTDTPGSGHYTTNGGEAHHYSTSEQIVGTWVDGKPLYEKTLHIVNQRMGHDPNASPQDTVIPHGINNLALMVSVKPCMYDTSSELKLPSDANGWYLNSDRNIGGAIRANNSSIYFYGGTGFTEASPTRHWYFTLRYTKTTD